MRNVEAYTDLADPSQLFRLASIFMYVARDQNKLRQSKKTNYARIFATQESDSLDVNDLHTTVVTQKVIGKVARIGAEDGVRHWGLRLVLPRWVRGDDNTDSYRDEYNFEWLSTETVLASRSIRLNSDTVQAGLDDLTVDNIADVFTQPDFLAGTNEFCKVSRADCSVLIADMLDLSKRS